MRTATRARTACPRPQEHERRVIAGLLRGRGPGGDGERCGFSRVERQPPRSHAEPLPAAPRHDLWLPAQPECEAGGNDVDEGGNLAGVRHANRLRLVRRERHTRRRCRERNRRRWRASPADHRVGERRGVAPRTQRRQRCSEADAGRPHVAAAALGADVVATSEVCSGSNGDRDERCQRATPRSRAAGRSERTPSDARSTRSRPGCCSRPSRARRSATACRPRRPSRS